MNFVDIIKEFRINHEYLEAYHRGEHNDEFDIDSIPSVKAVAMCEKLLGGIWDNLKAKPTISGCYGEIEVDWYYPEYSMLIFIDEHGRLSTCYLGAKEVNMKWNDIDSCLNYVLEYIK